MSNLLCFLFVSCGISAIWSLSDIFIPVRNFVAKRAPTFLRKMLLCMECSSFWIGVCCNFIFFPALIPTDWRLLISGLCSDPLLVILNDIISGVYAGAATYLTIKILNKKEIL